MIEGVKLIPLTTHTDERGFFREVLRVGDVVEFGQWSHSLMYTDTIKAWHIHQEQVDYWYLAAGVVKAALCDLRWLVGWEDYTLDIWPNVKLKTKDKMVFGEYLLGDNQPASVLVIPPGVAHGLKVLQGPAHLFYVTSKTYNPTDEGRIPYDALGYDWFKQDIK